MNISQEGKDDLDDLYAPQVSQYNVSDQYKELGNNVGGKLDFAVGAGET